MENKKESLSKIAWGQYKKNLPSYLALSFALLLVGLIVFGIEIALDMAFSLGGTVIVTIPFILIPFVFAVQYSMTHVRTGKNLDSKLIGGGYARYSTPGSPYFGVYRVITSFFKALLAYVILYSLTGAIYSSIANATSVEFREAIEKITQMLSDNTTTTEALLNYVTSNQAILTMYVCSAGVGYGAASYIFIRSIFVNSGSTYVRGMMLSGRAPNNIGNAIFQFGFRKIRKQYYKEYYKAMWPFIPLLIIGFAVGYIIPCVIPVEFPITIIPIFGFVGELVFVAFLVPYAFEVQHILTFSFGKEYSESSLELAKMNLEAMKARQSMTENESKDLEEQIKKAEEKMKEAEEKGESPFASEEEEQENDDNDQE